MSTSSCCFFFFSSRRRHTRCSRDWSSDVCSSDLAMFRRKTRDETWCTATRPQAFVSQQSPQDFVRALERRMRPGQFSEGGLLGPSEGLLDRLEADDDWLRRHEITHEQIADRLETVTGVAEHVHALVWETAIKSGCLNDAPQSFVVYDRLDVEITAYCGSQECPFS